MKTTLILAGAVAAAIAAPMIGAANAADNEKCYGIAAAGQNDCQTASSSCAGTATKASDPTAWIYLPAGTCTKIDGGSLEPKQS